MCGIIVIAGQKGSEIVGDSIKILHHRGPDGTRVECWEDFAFGFTRLAINDKTSSGMQPFHFGNYIGVFNGEIYNHKDLSKKYGLELNSECDTEVILPIFHKIGVGIIDELDGFYSGTIINTKTKEVFTVRDFIGKKPLLIGKAKDFSFLTSELKVITGVLDFEEIPLGFSKVFWEPPYFERIASHRLTKKNSPLETQLRESVYKRIPPGESKFGVFLSGGLDSSILSAIISSYTSNAIYFSLIEPDSPDFEYVKILREYLNIENFISVPLPAESELEKLIHQVVFHTESYNPSIISNGLGIYLLAQAAHNYGLKVVLTGEGADEVFCGYHSFEKGEKWEDTRKELLKNLHLTELRRVDLASMAHSIEIRCPFLDRNVVGTSEGFQYDDFYTRLEEKIQRKAILRKSFKDYLPKSIMNRPKISFDVGSGLRGLVVRHLTRSGSTEKEALLRIWKKFFDPNLAEKPWFHSYPTFDDIIEKRSHSHKQ